MLLFVVEAEDLRSNSTFHESKGIFRTRIYRMKSVSRFRVLGMIITEGVRIQCARFNIYSESGIEVEIARAECFGLTRFPC